MPSQTVTLSMPDSMYQRLRLRADQSNRTIEEETLDTLAAGMPSTDDLPKELAAAMAALHGLDEQALSRLAAGKLPTEEAAEMEALHRDERAGPLTTDQTARLAALVRAYETNMLIRARAAVLLKSRGHDVQFSPGS